MTISFAIQGKFVDMNVGKGHQLGTYIGRKRRGTNWYSKTMQSQYYRLGEIFLKQYAARGMNAAIRNIPQIVKM